MKTQRFYFTCSLGAVLIVGLVIQPAAARQGSTQDRLPRGSYLVGVAVPEPPGFPQDAHEQRKPKRMMSGLPPKWIDRLRGMSREEQERFLENNERFRNLPPERQEEIRRRLEHWNRLTPEQRRAIRERERVWQQMSPEQRRQVRAEIFPRWNQLPPERRRLLLTRLAALRELDGAERAVKLNEEFFLSGLTAEERVLLRDLSNLQMSPPSPGRE